MMIEVWLAKLEAALSAGDAEGAVALFHPDGFWRDFLAFTWNIKTMEGRLAILDMLKATLGHVKPDSWKIVGPEETSRYGTSAWITFETAVADCKGRVTLKDGLGYVMMTAMWNLRGHEEAVGAMRPKGIVHKADRTRKTWSEANTIRRASIGHDWQPHTLIIGGGQGGIALAARLKAFGVPALVVEKTARAGDNWRSRYRSLVLHDPVWYDHMPYLPFPQNWPVFTPKDKMGDWLEAYVRIFELDMWTSSTVENAERHYDHWDVSIRRSDGSIAVLQPKELVFATGAYGPPNVPVLPGQEKFVGSFIHSAWYQAGGDWKDKKVVVIGIGSSAHDVSVDLWEAGAEVTMIQRRAAIVVRSETLMETSFGDYSEKAVAAGMDVETADLLGAATPYALATEEGKEKAAEMERMDASFYAALNKAGFMTDFGEDGSGQMIRAMRTASGYYLDVGGSQLIIDGEIGVIAGESVEGFTETGVVLSSGREVAADLVVACTGFQSMNEAVAPIIDRATADAVGPCWGLGSGVAGDPGPWRGELRNMWKPTAVQGLWFHGGNLALSRFNSRFVALQLKARAEGIPTPVYGAPDGPGLAV